MTLRTLIPAMAVVLAIGGSALAQPGATPMYLASKDIDALVAKTKDGVATAQLPTGLPSHMVLVAHRVADGEVEVHKKLADEIIVRSGHAKIQVGGTVTGQRQTAPDEFRGGTMTGGQVFELKPGDAIWIPIGQPHQVLVPKGGQITYTAAKFPG